MASCSDRRCCCVGGRSFNTALEVMVVYHYAKELKGFIVAFKADTPSTTTSCPRTHTPHTLHTEARAARRRFLLTILCPSYAPHTPLIRPSVLPGDVQVLMLLTAPNPGEAVRGRESGISDGVEYALTLHQWEQLCCHYLIPWYGRNKALEEEATASKTAADDSNEGDDDGTPQRRSSGVGKMAERHLERTRSKQEEAVAQVGVGGMRV